MNNLIIAALTFVMLPALENNVTAKSIKSEKAAQKEIVVEKMDFASAFDKNTDLEKNYTPSVVDVDYIIEENGKAMITYINSDNQEAKENVVKFIDSATYSQNINPGKLYSMKLMITK